MHDKNNILKSNIILGGSQVVQMLTTILRAKLIAVFLGSAGMGLNAIIQSILLIVNNIASCGIMQSSVRELSKAQSSGDEDKLSNVTNIFRKLVLIAGGVGLVICATASWFFSFVSFGNSTYTITFIILGVGVLFYVFTHGEMAVLQGTRSLVSLSKGSIIGALLSLVICVPSFYYLGNNGIVISIVIGYFVFWRVYRYYTSKQVIKESKVNYKEAMQQGRPIIILGATLMLGSFMVSFFTYLTNISIRFIGSLNDVGLYQGAASITTQSIIIVISVLASDFYPRLSAIVDDKEVHNSLVNEQADIVMLIIAPIVVIIICCSDLIVRLLLTSEFAVIIPLLEFMSISLLFRGMWITMSYVILAHGDRKSYLMYDAILGNGLNFLINIIAYYIGGLTLLGISYIVSSIVVSIILYIVVKKSYGFEFNRNFVKTFIIAVLLIGGTYVAHLFNYWVSIACMVCVMILSIYNLSIRFDLFSILKIKISK